MWKVCLIILLVLLPPAWAQKPAVKAVVHQRTAVIAPRAGTSTSPVVLFNNQNATAAATSPLTPNALQSGFGTLTVSGAGIGGSSTCTLNLYYANLSSGTVATTPFASVINFALSNGFQTFSITPTGGASNTAADGLVSTYSCTTYPTSGTFSASFSTSLPTTINLPSTGGLIPLIACNQHAIISTNNLGSTQLIAAAPSYSIYICGWTINTASTTAVNVKLVTGTGTNCGTGASDVSETVALQALAATAPAGAVMPVPANTVNQLPLNQSLCVNLSAAQQVYGIVWDAQF